MHRYMAFLPVLGCTLENSAKSVAKQVVTGGLVWHSIAKNDCNSASVGQSTSLALKHFIPGDKRGCVRKSVKVPPHRQANQDQANMNLHAPKV